MSMGAFLLARLDAAVGAFDVTTKTCSMTRVYASSSDLTRVLWHWLAIRLGGVHDRKELESFIAFKFKV